MQKESRNSDSHVYQRVISSQQNQVQRTIQISLLCVLVGIIAGLGAAGFKYLIEFFHNLFFSGTFSFVHNKGGSISRWGAFVIVVPALGIMIAQWITAKWAPEAKGHGVPEVMLAVAQNKGKIRPVVALVKSFASAITIGSGGSVGKEGPIVQIGASFGSTLGQAFKLTPRETIILVGAGVSGGISATFNAPIGGVMFALELILPEYSIMTIMPLVVSSIIATSIGCYFLGAHPAFIIAEYSMVSSSELIFYMVLGVLAGLFSVLFIKSVYGVEDFFKKIKIPATAKAIIGGLLVGSMGYISLRAFGSYHVFGVGYDFLDLVLDNQITSLVMAFTLVIMKILANSITLASGGSGGIFAPSLFLGGSLGASVGIIVNSIFPETTGPISAYAIVGMAAMVSGVTGGVLTAIIMVFEMTRNYAIMLPLLLSGVISYFVARLLFGETMYTQKLTRRGIQIQLDKQIPYLKTSTVGEIMKTEIVSCKPDDTTGKVWDIMHEHGLGLLPVIDGDTVIGTIGYIELHQSKCNGEDVITPMIRPVDICIPSSANLYEAFIVMDLLHSDILIVKEDEKVVGLVTANRITRTYIQKRRNS